MSVWDYFQDREREFAECSLTPANDRMFFSERDEQRGKIIGCLYFDGYPPSVYMTIHEDVVVRGSGCTRPRYAYFLIIDGLEIGGFERHATHDPPVHKHCSGNAAHERSPCRAMSFKSAAAEAWRYVSALASPMAEASV